MDQGVRREKLMFAMIHMHSLVGQPNAGHHQSKDLLCCGHMCIYMCTCMVIGTYCNRRGNVA